MKLTAEKFNAMVAKYWPDNRFSVTDISEHGAVVSLTPSEAAIRPGGFISGPVQFAAADMALWVLASASRDRPEPMAMTSDLSIRYLRPAAGERLYAKAVSHKASGRTVIGSVDIWTDDNEDQPCAIAQGTYVLPAE
jgi:uncharacterized protein (TIGR00369 family)